MSSILLFAGTSEGRELAERLAGRNLDVYVSVATGYGETLLPHTGLQVLQGRMDEKQIKDFLIRHSMDLVIDATHPYAVLATKYIQSACQNLGVAYRRLLRAPVRESANPLEGCFFVNSAQAAAKMLVKTQGNVLLTTGSKDLSAFTVIPQYQQRFFIRILPSADAIQQALSLGFVPSHVICMQGPFSEELNLALLNQFAIGIMVTKESGKAGGFLEKWKAAQTAQVETIVIGRPPQAPGESLEAIWLYLKERFLL